MTSLDLFELGPNEQLSRVEQFVYTLKQGDRDIDFVITIREFAKPELPTMRFFAQSDRQTNQEAIPYTPSGWGRTGDAALADCLRAIRRFPYQGD